MLPSIMDELYKANNKVHIYGTCTRNKALFRIDTSLL